MIKTTQFMYVEDVEAYIENLTKLVERAPFYQTPLEIEIETLRREIENKCYQRKNGSLPPQLDEAVRSPEQKNGTRRNKHSNS